MVVGSADFDAVAIGVERPGAIGGADFDAVAIGVADSDAVTIGGADFDVVVIGVAADVAATVEAAPWLIGDRGSDTDTPGSSSSSPSLELLSATLGSVVAFFFSTTFLLSSLSASFTFFATYPPNSPPLWVTVAGAATLGGATST